MGPLVQAPIRSLLARRSGRCHPRIPVDRSVAGQRGLCRIVGSGRVRGWRVHPRSRIVRPLHEDGPGVKPDDDVRGQAWRPGPCGPRGRPQGGPSVVQPLVLGLGRVRLRPTLGTDQRRQGTGPVGLAPLGQVTAVQVPALADTGGSLLRRHHQLAGRCLTLCRRSGHGAHPHDAVGSGQPTATGSACAGLPSAAAKSPLLLSVDPSTTGGTSKAYTMFPMTQGCPARAVPKEQADGVSVVGEEVLAGAACQAIDVCVRAVACAESDGLATGRDDDRATRRPSPQDATSGTKSADPCGSWRGVDDMAVARHW